MNGKWAACSNIVRDKKGDNQYPGENLMVSQKV
jgi:hypothetical protein